MKKAPFGRFGSQLSMRWSMPQICGKVKGDRGILVVARPAVMGFCKWTGKTPAGSRRYLRLVVSRALKAGSSRKGAKVGSDWSQSRNGGMSLTFSLAWRRVSIAALRLLAMA
jgi:hypothetical protein